MHTEQWMLSEQELQFLRNRALSVRRETIRLISSAKAGHYSSVFSCAEIFTALYYDSTRRRRGEPDWPGREHTLKPIDRAAVERAMSWKIALILERHNLLGDLGGAVAEVMAEKGGSTSLVRHGIRDEYSLITPPTYLYAHYKSDAAGTEDVALEVLRG